MSVREYISTAFPKADALSGVNAIAEELVQYHFLVVTGENGEFVGVLTPEDLIKRPHKLVIDCLSEKERLSADEELFLSLEKFQTSKATALPVFDENGFCGILEKKRVIEVVSETIESLHNQSLISQNLKNIFLNNLSHEVRTPMNAILGFVELLKQNHPKKPDFDTYYADINNHASRFLYLINDLVELSLMQSREPVVLHCCECRLEKLFLDLKDYFDKECIKKTISIQYVDPDPSLMLRTDGEKLKRILFHLLDNAVKFSERGAIVFGYKFLEENMIKFFVKNSDSVVPESMKTKLFEAFERVLDAKGKIYPGLGIGLTLSGKYVELLGGKMSFESSEDRGTSFCFTHPLVSSHGTPILHTPTPDR